MRSTVSAAGCSVRETGAKSAASCVCLPTAVPKRLTRLWERDGGWCQRQHQHVWNPGCARSPPLLQGPTVGEVDVGRLHPWPTRFLNAPSTADGDDGAPLQASKSPSSLQPALSIAAAPPSNQRSPPAAQPQMPFSVAAPNAGPTHVSPFGAAATPAPLFAAPQSASSGPASPPRTGDRALSWVAMWCARAEAEGMQCLPPPSSPSWQQLVASGSLGGALGQR